MLIDRYKAVMPGGKYHAVATKLLENPDAVLQWRGFTGEWQDWKPIGSPPQFSVQFEWRIKPQRKLHRYRLAVFNNQTMPLQVCNDPTMESAFTSSTHFVDWLDDWKTVELPEKKE